MLNSFHLRIVHCFNDFSLLEGFSEKFNHNKNSSKLENKTLYHSQIPYIESRQVDKVRSKRGKVTRSSPDFKLKNEVKQHLEAVEAESMPLDIQTNFLSESVRKYLELGRAIPGDYFAIFPFYHI